MEQGSAEPGPGPYTMDGLCNLYLPVILLMRSGDIETNPGPNTPESTVSEEEYLELSERIGASNYKRVGIRLGIPYTVLSGIQHQSDDYSDHFMKVFMKWRDRQPPGTNTRAVLAEELQTCHLDELSDLLLDGSLVKSRTYKPSAVPVTSQPHQPLSPELVKRCSEDFKFKYRTTLCKIRADPLNPDSLMQFEDMYTNLVLEEEHGRNRRKLEYRDLLNLKDNGKFPRRLLVQGEAGAGKTTLCAKIAWDWINGKHLQDVAWLIIVPLREAKKYTIGEIAKSYLTSNNPATASQLTEYMHLNPDKVFILFDGLDEFSGDGVPDKEVGSQSEGHKSPHHQSAKATGQSSQAEDHLSHAKGQSPQEIEIGEILRSQKLETCPVIVTTRPWKAREIRWNDSLRELYTFLHVEGFSEQNVAEYIRKYFADEEAKAETLIQFARDSDVISEYMAPYPIYIAMLCLMWREFDEEKREMMKSLQTFSQIFKEMFVFLKEHYALKLSKESCSVDEPLNDRLKKIETLLDPITKLALNGLLNDTLVFKEGDFEHCPGSMETACKVGVLSEENRIIPRKSRQNASYLRKQSTVFFPHKLFQEFMAGIHLASLYVTDKAEYSRLIEKVTGQRKEEFRYLLYFTASQNQTVGINVLTHIIARSMQREDDSHFLVDVAFECHDTNTASLVKDKVSLPNSALNIDHRVTAHTVAGYAIIQPDMVRLTVSRLCGPTMSHNVAEMICSVPSLKEVSLQSKLHINFFMTLAAQGQISQVKSLRISHGVLPFSTHVSYDLALAQHSMPNLTEPTMPHDEFCSSLKARASPLKVKSLQITQDVVPVSVPALLDLSLALCSMPNLTDLTLPGTVLCHEFCSSLKVRASSMKTMKVKSLEISGDVVPLSAPASRDLVVALWSMPNLTKLTIPGNILSHEFCSTLKARASSMKVKSVKISGDVHVVPLSAPASYDLVMALWSLPNLTELTLPGRILCAEFCSTLKERALFMKVKSLKFSGDVVPLSAPASHDLVIALWSLQNLTELTMPGRILFDEFFSTLKERALSMKLKSLQITGRKVRVSAPALHDFVVALCSMPNLTELTIPGDIISGEFCSTLKAMASSMKLKSLQITGREVRVSAPALYDFVVALCSMPNLTELTIPGEILCDHDEFYRTGDISGEFCSALKAMASSMKIKSLEILGDVVRVSAPVSHDLVAALCSMPNLTELTIPYEFLSHEFCSTLEERALSMKLKSLQISDCAVPVSAPALHDLAVALCSMPNLTELTLLGTILCHEFCSALKVRASSMKLRSLEISGGENHVSAPVSHDLAVALCSMPNLTELTVPGWILSNEFCSTLKERASSMKNCFPQISKGNFTFNGTPQANLESFMLEIASYTRYNSVSPSSVQFQDEWEEEDEEEEEGKMEESTFDMCTNVSDASWYPPETRLRGLDTSVSFMRGSRNIPIFRQLDQSSVLYDQPGTSRDLGDVHQTYHEEHGSMSRHSGYSIPDPMSGFDSHSEPTSPLPPQADRPMFNVLQLPLTVRSRSGRSQSVKKTAPCTQSRVPKDIPEKRPRVGTPEESPSVKLCDYSSSDESSTS